jgi:hypothetical protein
MSKPRVGEDPEATVHLRLMGTIKRRASVRYCLPAGTGALIQAASRSEPGWLINASVTGLGLLLGRQLEPGTPLEVQVRGAPPVLAGLAARVVHCTPQAAGEWLVGCVLEWPLTEAALQALVADRAGR